MGRIFETISKDKAARRSLHAFGEWCQKNAERDPHRSL